MSSSPSNQQHSPVSSQLQSTSSQQQQHLQPPRRSQPGAPSQLGVSTLLPTSPGLDQDAPSSAASTSFRADWPAGNGLSIGQPGSQFTTSPTSYAAPSRRNPDDSIEMDAIAPAGHRRRRSTLTASAGFPSASRTPHHTRSLSVKGPAGESEPKISEEGTSSEFTRPDHRANNDSEGSISDEDLHDDEETGLTKKERERKKAKKRRNTRLDQRVAREKLTDEERHLADVNVVKRLAINMCLIGLWYFFSLSISLVRVSCALSPPSPGLPRLLRWLNLMLTRSWLERSITSGCLTPIGSTSHSPYSRPPCTCSCNSLLPH